MLVGLHRAGGAIGGLVLGDGAAVGIGCGLGSAAVLGGNGLPLVPSGLVVVSTFPVLPELSRSEDEPPPEEEPPEDWA